MADISNASSSTFNATFMSLYSHGDQMNRQSSAASMGYANMDGANSSIYDRPALYSANQGPCYSCNTKVYRCDSVAGPVTSDPNANLYQYDLVYGAKCPCNYVERKEC